MIRSRSEQRSGFDPAVRIELLEADADDQERGFDQFRAEMKAEMQALRQLATGILTALVVASVMLAINLAVVR